MDNGWTVDILPPDLATDLRHIAHLDASVEEVYTSMLRAVCLLAPEGEVGARICASIRLHGEYTAECAVEVPVAAGDRLTDVMLGTEADWDDEMIDDAVGELCNMITGGLKRRLGLWRAVCRTSLPSVCRKGAAELSVTQGAAIRRVYCFGEDRIAVTLSFLPASSLPA